MSKFPEEEAANIDAEVPVDTAVSDVDTFPVVALGATPFTDFTNDEVSCVTSKVVPSPFVKVSVSTCLTDDVSTFRIAELESIAKEALILDL